MDKADGRNFRLIKFFYPKVNFDLGAGKRTSSYNADGIKAENFKK